MLLSSLKYQLGTYQTALLSTEVIALKTLFPISLKYSVLPLAGRTSLNVSAL